MSEKRQTTIRNVLIKPLPRRGDAREWLSLEENHTIQNRITRCPGPIFTTRTSCRSPASKASSDHLARAYHHAYGLPTLTANCSNNYGPYQFPEKLIPLMILNCLEGKALRVYGEGAQIRDWLYVGDRCRAIRAVLARGRAGEACSAVGIAKRKPQGGSCHLPGSRYHAPGTAPRPLHITHDVRQGSAGPRPPLRDRFHEDSE